MSVYKGGTSYSANEDAAQTFLQDKLSNNKFNSSDDYSTEGFDPSSYTSEQLSALNASGGAKKFGKKSYSVTSNQDEIDNFVSVTGGGTERYADYDNTNEGQTAFTDSWQDGAKYQQLRGSGGLNNDAFNSQFESAQGGEDTKTVADDGGGWKLIKQDKGEKSDERKLEYKDLAEQWQAAGYDVRVQDHNPDFEGGTGEIAVRVSGSQGDKPEAKTTQEEVVHSPEIQQAKARVGKYENDVLSGKTSQDIYGGASAFSDNYQLNLQGGSTQMFNAGNYQFDSSTPGFNGSNISAEDKTPAPVQAASSFLENQKKKAVKDFNIKPTN
jgi:hypothetical protein